MLLVPFTQGRPYRHQQDMHQPERKPLGRGCQNQQHGIQYITCGVKTKWKTFRGNVINECNSQLQAVYFKYWTFPPKTSPVVFGYNGET